MTRNPFSCQRLLQSESRPRSFGQHLLGTSVFKSRCLKFHSRPWGLHDCMRTLPERKCWIYYGSMNSFRTNLTPNPKKLYKCCSVTKPNKTCFEGALQMLSSSCAGCFGGCSFDASCLGQTSSKGWKGLYHYYYYYS